MNLFIKIRFVAFDMSPIEYSTAMPDFLPIFSAHYIQTYFYCRTQVYGSQLFHRIFFRVSISLKRISRSVNFSFANRKTFTRGHIRRAQYLVYDIRYVFCQKLLQNEKTIFSSFGICRALMYFIHKTLVLTVLMNYVLLNQLSKTHTTIFEHQLHDFTDF